MKMKIFILMFCLVLLAGPVAAEDFIFKQDVERDVIVNCINNGVCSSSTVCNVTINDPDSIILIDNQQTTRSTNGGYYNYTLNSTQLSKLGEYQIGGFCKDGSVSKPIDFKILVTKTGTLLTIGESIVYLILTLAVFIFFLLSLYFAIITPYENTIDEDGAVLKICKWKYVKIGLIMLSYVLFTWFLNVLIGISDNFITLTLYYGFVSFLFMLLNSIALYLGIFCLVLMGYETIKDLNIQKEIKKWGKYKPNA